MITSGPFSGLQRNGYPVVLADPAWAFLTYTGQGTPHRTEEDHYPVMSLADLKALPVADLARPRVSVPRRRAASMFSAPFSSALSLTSTAASFQRRASSDS